MSNQVVGSVYQQIIEKVTQSSSNDFEEFGVDQSTLGELKQLWQDKLSSLHVAQFPWDPQQEPVRNPPTVPSNVPKAEPSPAPSSSAQSIQQEPANNFPNVQIKQEGGGYLPQNQPYMNGMGGGLDNNAAMSRAQNLINQRFGVTLPNANQQAGNPQMAGQQQMRMQMPGQAQQGQRPQHMQQRQPNVYASQTDGADEALDEWKAIVAARHAEAEQDRRNYDNMMRAQVDAMTMQLDSGLMVPLDQVPNGKKRKAAIKAAVRAQQQQQASAPSPPSMPQIPQLDGELGIKDEDEDEKDEDAINSDLDDPDDNLDGDDDDNDENIDVMLCTYDKVQRVKNKWKCTLKDGILTTNKKEYLFHKANGEFEW